MHPVLITYHSTSSASPYILRILASLRAQLPLRNLHGKAAAGTGGAKAPIRSIQEVDVEFIALPQAEGLNFSLAKEIGYGSLIVSPLVNLLFVECDDSEIYKNSLRPAIKDWQRKLKDPSLPCLVVLISTTSSSTDDKRSSVFSNLKAQAGAGGGSILAKLKSDFETPSKKDKCIQLSLPPPSANAVTRLGTGHASTSSLAPLETSSYVELITTLKELVLSSFDIVIAEREESVKKGEAQRALPGWNWGAWFLRKECLAYSYEDMHLLQDALLQYEELDAHLMQIMRTGNFVIGSGVDSTLFQCGSILPGIPHSSSGSSLGPPSTPRAPTISRDRSPSPSRSPLQSHTPVAATYQERIAAGTFTIYDYRAYLFKRQAHLFVAMLGMSSAAGKDKDVNERVQEIARRGEEFVLATGRYIRENQGSDLEAAFLAEAWTFAATTSVIATCNKLGDSRSGTENNDGLMSNLRKIKVLQTDRVGVRKGYLPSSFPFLLSQDLLPEKNQILFDGSPPSSPNEPTSNFSQTIKDFSGCDDSVLLSSSHSREAFYRLYKDELDQARDAATASGRHKLRSELDTRLAALAYHQGDLLTSRSMYMDILNQDLQTALSSEWRAPHSEALRRALDCGFKQGVPFDSEIFEMSLGFLQSLWRDNQHCRDWLSPGELAEVKSICEKVSTGWVGGPWAQADKVIEIPQHQLFKVELLSSLAEQLDNEDGCVVKARVWNTSPITMDLSDVRMCFTGRELEQLWFTSSAVTLEPGWNEIHLTCLMPVFGLFRLEQARLLRGNVIFSYIQPEFSLESTSLERGLLRISSDPLALSAMVNTPSQVALQTEPRLEFRIEFGRNDLVGLKLSASAVDDAVHFRWQSSEVVDRSELVLERGLDSVSFTSIERKGGSVVTSVPYSSLARVDFLEVRVSVDYTTTARPQLWRAYRSTQRVDLSLPLAVNVQDFFRPSCLISKFTISSANGHAVRIRSATLVSDSQSPQYHIDPCRKTQTTMDVLPNQPVSYLFKVRQAVAGSRKDHSEVLRLVLQYRTLEEEVDLAVKALVTMLSDSGESSVNSNITRTLQSVVKTANSGVWLPSYLLSGSLQLGNDHVRGWREVIARQLETQGLPSDKLIEVEEACLKAIRWLETHSLTEIDSIPWRTLDIPVDVPIMTVVCSSRFRFPENCLTLLGVPIPVELLFNSSFTWAQGDEESQQVKMMYDVVTDSDSWLVSGTKRGTFLAKASTPHVVHLSLMPMKHGHLLLPSITTIPITAGGEQVSAENHQADAAKRILVYPVQRTANFRILADGQGGMPLEGGDGNSGLDGFAINPQQRLAL